MPLIKEILRKYKNGYKCLIETGTYEGDTVQLALDEGFEKVYSIELSEQRYLAAVNRFRGNARVKIVNGDSSVVLPDIMKEVDLPTFFWLDAHLDGCVDAPLFNELNSIAQHPLKNHIILIDDVRRFGEYLVNVSKESLTKKLLEVNPAYQICYENDGWSVDDVMVAHL